MSSGERSAARDWPRRWRSRWRAPWEVSWGGRFSAASSAAFWEDRRGESERSGDVYAPIGLPVAFGGAARRRSRHALADRSRPGRL